MTNKKRSCLGKSLIRDRFRKSEVPRLPFNVYDNELTFEPNLESVTTTSDIATLLESAQLLAEKYTVENDGVMLVDSSFATSLEQGEQLQCSKNSQLLLTIPRRPKWTKQTNSQLLLELERKEFLNWRRQLAFIQKDVLLLTPYERNLEVWRQLWRVIEKSHVVVQLVDARNPLLFYCADLFRYVKEIDPLKKNILLINKADLLTKAQRFYWTTYFENNQVEHAFWSALQCTQDEDFKDSQDSQIDSSGILTRSELLHKLKNSFTGNTGVDKTGQVRPLTFGMVGYPNVGKSSTINALLKCNKVSVSATPGKTKHFQTHYLDSGLLLMDCPGLVFPNFVSTKAEMLCSGILPVDQLRDPVPPATLIAQRIPRSALESTYGLHIVRPCEEEDPERPATGYELLHAFGNARGFMTSHGLPEVQKSARILIKDYIKGKLLYCHPPPGVPNEVFNPHLFSAVSSGEKTVLPANENTALLFSTSGSITKDKYNYQSLAKAAGLMGDTRFWGKIKGKTEMFPVESEVLERDEFGRPVGKPWRYHNNKNKRGKLRRLYYKNTAL